MPCHGQVQDPPGSHQDPLLNDEQTAGQRRGGARACIRQCGAYRLLAWANLGRISSPGRHVQFRHLPPSSWSIEHRLYGWSARRLLCPQAIVALHVRGLKELGMSPDQRLVMVLFLQALRLGRSSMITPALPLTIAIKHLCVQVGGSTLHGS